MFGIQAFSNLFSSSQRVVVQSVPNVGSSISLQLQPQPRASRKPRSWQQDRVKSDDVELVVDETCQKSANLNLALAHGLDYNAAIIAARLEWLFLTRLEFYKFGGPCNHEDYRVGDSLEEDLNLSRYKFNKGFHKIGVTYNSTAALSEVIHGWHDPFCGKLYLRYYNRQNHKMYYVRNEEVANELFPNTRKLPLKYLNTKTSYQKIVEHANFIASQNPTFTGRPTPSLEGDSPSDPIKSLLIPRIKKFLILFKETDLSTNLLLGSRARPTLSPEIDDREEKRRDSSGSVVSPSTVIPDVTSKKLASRKSDKETVTSRHANTRRKEEKNATAHKEPSSLVQEMLSIWKNVVGKLIHGGSANTLRSDMPAEMEAILNTHFQGDVNEWLKFCREKILTSRLLMGEKEGSRFYGNGAYLSWTLNNIERIKNGDFDTNRVIPKTEAELQIEARQRELIDQRQSLLNRKDGLHAEIQQSREDTLRKAVTETSEEDKANLFPEFVKAQETKGHKVEASDSPIPWQGLSLLDRLMWESTLADFVRPRLFSEDIDVVVQQKLLEERVEERLGEITSALVALNVQKEALGAATCEKQDAAASSSLNAPQQSSSAATATPQDEEAPLEHQAASEDLLPEDDFEPEDEGWEELKDPFEDEPFTERQEIFDDEWIAQEYGTQDNPTERMVA